MFVLCLYGLQGVLRFLARSEYRINTSLCADKIVYLFFQAEKDDK